MRIGRVLVLVARAGLLAGCASVTETMRRAIETIERGQMPKMLARVMCVVALTCAGCSAGEPTAPLPPTAATSTSTPTAATTTPAPRKSTGYQVAPMPSGGPLVFDAAVERPCDLLTADKAAELGWRVPGRERSSEAGKTCRWSASDSGEEAQAGAIAAFDLSRWRSRFGATDITISGRQALVSTNIRGFANVFVDLGERRGLYASVSTADLSDASDATVAAAESLAAAVLENMSVA